MEELVAEFRKGDALFGREAILDAVRGNTVSRG